jgi:hypothetical protein
MKLKMKNVLKPLLVMVLVTLNILSAGMRSDEVLFVAWGDEENDVKHISYPGLHTGPMSFQVTDNSVILFDTENRKLKTYRDGALLTSERLNDPFILDFYKDNDRLYTMEPQAIYVSENGIKRKVAALADPKYMFNGLKNENGAIVSSSDKGTVLCSPYQLNKGIATEIKVTRTIPATVNVAINGKMYDLSVPNVGSVDYLGSTPDQKHYIYAESIVRNVPLKVQRHIMLINNDAEVLTTLNLPEQKYTYVFKEFFVDEAGDLYHMQSSKDGIHIIKWSYVDDNVNETNYPEAFSDAYHFNDFIQEEPESANPPALAKPAGEITRGEALATADDYVTHIWTATASNIGTTSTVTTPDWIQIGQNQRVPYQWGGYSTIAQFDAGIANGKYAGDRNTSVVDLNNAVGADCSGYVSICWTSGRYSTSSFHYVTTELSSFNDLLPADATNKAGSHIRLVVEWTSDGRLRQVEETASGTPGWAARYYTWRLSDITGYVPIRYNQIQNSLAPRPTLLSVVSKPDSVTLNWTADEGAIFSGYRVYGRTVGEEYDVRAEVPKGILSVTMSQNDDQINEYFVAAYVSGDSANYNPSDIYAAKGSDDGKQILVVDGFDRMGSWGLPTHSFGAKTAVAMDHWGVNVDACVNEAVISGDVDLKDYDMVWWICGDESTADETFNDIEQDSVESFLDQGGKFFVSGSEIGWDLDNKGTTSDKTFIHNYLKATYSSDDAGAYAVNGVSTTVFNGIDLRYSSDGSGENTYPEDYPDSFTPNGGSQAVLKYSNGQNAAVAYSGTFPGGSAEGKVMIMGFPFETITDIQECDSLAGAILDYMDMTVQSSIEASVPADHQLYQNYPNPFNPSTIIAYELNRNASVHIRIFNIKGEEVRDLNLGQQNSGTHRLNFNGTMLPSGMYVYGLEINGEISAVRKMTLMK